jgi:hypothetical protein
MPFFLERGKRDMSRPDTTGSFSMGLGILGAIVLIMVIGGIFFYFTGTSLYIALFTIVPLVGFLLSALIHTQSQLMMCPSLHAKTILYGGLPTVVTSLVGMGIASIPFCRIPVASVVAPWVTTPPASSCCAPSPSLKDVEKAHPSIMAASYGFYTFFAMMFGVVIGSGISSAC